MSLSETEAVQALVRGDLVAIPTETVYGLAARAFDEDAVARVFQVKGRPNEHPLIVHVATQGEARALTRRDALWDAWWERLTPLLQMWPGPLTMVFPKADMVPYRVTGGAETVAIRIPNHAATLRVLAATGPLVAPSANRFTMVSPTQGKHLWPILGEIAGYLDGGDCAVGVESTIVDASEIGVLRCLRLGGISAAEVAARMGLPVVLGGATKAPGTHKVHYAPQHAKVILIQGVLHAAVTHLSGARWVVPKGFEAGLAAASATTWDSSADLAKNLYALLHQADAEQLSNVVFWFPTELQRDALLDAVIDRLTRAAARNS